MAGNGTARRGGLCPARCCSAPQRSTPNPAPLCAASSSRTPTAVPVAARLYIESADENWFFVRSADSRESAVECRKQWLPSGGSEMHTSLSPQPFTADLPTARYTLTVERGKEYFPWYREVQLSGRPMGNHDPTQALVPPHLLGAPIRQAAGNGRQGSALSDPRSCGWTRRGNGPDRLVLVLRCSPGFDVIIGIERLTK